MIEKRIYGNCFEKITDNVKEHKQDYMHSANVVTLALWALALGSHAILLPIFIRELYEDITQHRPPRPLCVLKEAKKM